MSMTDLEHDPQRIPDTAELRRVLAALRYEQPLDDSPLVELDAVWEVLLREGVAPGTRGRAWALGLLIDELVREQLEAARRASGVATSTDDRGEARLVADFAANSPTLEVWSSLYHRYLDPGQLPAGEIAATVGMPRRTLSRRQGVALRKLARALADRDRAAARSLAERPDVPIVDTRASRISDSDRSAPAPSKPDQALLQAVRGTGERRVPVAPEVLERLAAERPADLDAYRLSRVAAWSRPAYRVDARFVGLTLLIDRREEAPDRWQAESETHDDLDSVMASVESQAVVLLGPPGSGKSTLLRRFELDLATAGLRGETE
jgi:hypothetical protein